MSTVSILAIMRSTAWTAWARRRKSRSIRAICLGASGTKRLSQAGSPVPTTSNAGVRGARSPGNACPSLGAGVNGECGANVAISSRNGCRRAAVDLMNSTPLAESTLVR